MGFDAATCASQLFSLVVSGAVAQKSSPFAWYYAGLSAPPRPSLRQELHGQLSGRLSIPTAAAVGALDLSRPLIEEWPHEHGEETWLHDLLVNDLKLSTGDIDELFDLRHRYDKAFDELADAAGRVVRAGNVWHMQGVAIMTALGHPAHDWDGRRYGLLRAFPALIRRLNVTIEADPSSAQAAAARKDKTAIEVAEDAIASSSTVFFERVKEAVKKHVPAGTPNARLPSTQANVLAAAMNLCPLPEEIRQALVGGVGDVSCRALWRWMNYWISGTPTGDVLARPTSLKSGALYDLLTTGDHPVAVVRAVYFECHNITPSDHRLCLTTYAGTTECPNCNASFDETRDRRVVKRVLAFLEATVPVELHRCPQCHNYVPEPQTQCHRHSPPVRLGGRTTSAVQLDCAAQRSLSAATSPDSELAIEDLLPGSGADPADQAIARQTASELLREVGRHYVESWRGGGCALALWLMAIFELPDILLEAFRQAGTQCLMISDADLLAALTSIYDGSWATALSIWQSQAATVHELFHPFPERLDPKDLKAARDQLMDRVFQVFDVLSESSGGSSGTH